MKCIPRTFFDLLLSSQTEEDSKKMLTTGSVSRLIECLSSKEAHVRSVAADAIGQLATSSWVFGEMSPRKLQIWIWVV